MSYSYLLTGFIIILFGLIVTYAIYFSYNEIFYPARVLAQPDENYLELIDFSKMKEMKLEEETHFINMGINN
jgi:hypothetical protein